MRYRPINPELFKTNRENLKALLPKNSVVVVNSNEKKRARLESIRHVLHSLDYEHKDTEVARAPDPFVVQPAAQVMSPTGLPTFE